MSNYAPAHPHGPIEEAFPNVFFVRGRYKAGPGVHFDRNMTIVRTGKDLIAINSVRLTEAGEAELARLGQLTHVIRLGAFHGVDDPYYVDKFGATLWGAPRITHKMPAKELTPADKPLDAEVFYFEQGKQGEAALLLPLDGGILVTCDSYQNWTTFEHCSWLARQFVKRMGFGPAVIGASPWVKAMGKDVRTDLERLADKPFRHLMPGHGTILRDEARAKLGLAIRARFD